MRFALLAALFSCATVQAALPSIETCGKADIQADVADLAPVVGSILDSQTNGWQKQLEALAFKYSEQAVACTVSAFTEAAPIVTAPDAVRPVVLKTPKRTANAHLYLNRSKP